MSEGDGTVERQDGGRNDRKDDGNVGGEEGERAAGGGATDIGGSRRLRDIEDAFAAPECLNCGACCFSAAENYVPVTGDDWSRLGPDAEKWAAFVSNRVFMRMEHGHCAALQLVIPQEAGGVGRFVCSIYTTRPQVCRDLARGAAECHGEWTMKRQIAAAAADRLNQK